MTDIFFTPIRACQEPKGGLTLFGLVRRVSTLLAGFIPAGACAATQDVATSLAPVAPGNLGMLSNEGVYPFDPQHSGPKKT